MPEAKSEPKSERRVFTEEFKRDAVRLANERGNAAQVARDLGLNLPRFGLQ